MDLSGEESKCMSYVLKVCAIMKRDYLKGPVQVSFEPEQNVTIMNSSQKLLRDISLKYEEVEVFQNFTLEVPQGKITTIVGPSGCGKTSLLNMMADLLPATEGKVQTQDETIGYIFQEDRLLPWETVYENVKLVREIEDRQEIMSILEALEIEDFADKYPDQLSGGMRQRCAIARGFYFHSTLLLMDEPFKSLDYDLRLNLINYLGKLWKRTGNTIIFVTHDIDEALLLGHQILVLSRRPSVIAEKFHRDSDLGTRDISDEDHIRCRRKIVSHLSMKGEA